jgi:hypothetical protein
LKRFLSALLCAILLLGLLPGVASGASVTLPGAAPERVSIRDAWMTMSHTYAYVGDKIEFLNCKNKCNHFSIAREESLLRSLYISVAVQTTLPASCN